MAARGIHNRGRLCAALFNRQKTTAPTSMSEGRKASAGAGRRASRPEPWAPWMDDQTTSRYRSDHLSYAPTGMAARKPARAEHVADVRAEALAAPSGHAGVALLWVNTVAAALGLFGAVLLGQLLLGASKHTPAEHSSAVVLPLSNIAAQQQGESSETSAPAPATQPTAALPSASPAEPALAAGVHASSAPRETGSGGVHGDGARASEPASTRARFRGSSVDPGPASTASGPLP
jgi:hypothetical protein